MRALWRRQHRMLITLFSGLIILAGTYLAIQYAKGYRPGDTGFLQGTGLLSATSNPPDAQIYIDGELQNLVTDDTVNLYPGEYDVEIAKIGFTSWKKRLTIFKELVTTTDAHLFRSVPILTPLTFAGAENLTPSPDGQKIAFTVASPSAQLKAGLYILDLNDRPSLFSRGARLIAENPVPMDFKDAHLLWSPDSQEILASFIDRNYLLDTSRSVRQQDLVGATTQLPFILSNWEQEMTRREKQLFASLPDEILAIATQSAKNIYFSPNGEKLVYTATGTVTIPDRLIPPLPASNTQLESRDLEAESVYVYDILEDKNYLIMRNVTEQPDAKANFNKIQLVTDLTNEGLFNPEATASDQLKLQDPVSMEQTIANFQSYYSSFPFLNYQWFPTSKHLLINRDGSIQITEYDGTNLTTLFSGIYDPNFVYPWPNGEKLIILTNLTQNPDLPPNLYTINLK